MNRPLCRRAVWLLIVVAVASLTVSPAYAQRGRGGLGGLLGGGASANVEVKKVDIMSEGTRMAGETFIARENADKKLPTVVMSHGWGGNESQLRADAQAFASAGYFVLAFDYRGWGASDSRVILTGKKPAASEIKNNKFTAEVLEVREVVDPIDMSTDIINAISWVWGEKNCDRDRIGLWGSSYSGGHVMYVAARDPRVKCFVSQVGSFDSRPFTIGTDAEREKTFTDASKRAHGEIGYPKPGAVEVGTLRGAPIREKVMQYAPVEDAVRAGNCAMLIIVAEAEDLFDNKINGIRAFNDAKTPNKKLVSVPGAKHYDVYTTAKPQVQRLAIEWYDEHLKKLPSKEVK